MARELLFSYRTLQLEPIQLAIIGRTLTGQPDVLPGFEETFVEIDNDSVQSLTGKSRHVMAKFTGRPSDTIPGTVFALTTDGMEKADVRDGRVSTRISAPAVRHARVGLRRRTLPAFGRMIAATGAAVGGARRRFKAGDVSPRRASRWRCSVSVYERPRVPHSVR